MLFDILLHRDIYSGTKFFSRFVSVKADNAETLLLKSRTLSCLLFFVKSTFII